MEWIRFDRATPTDPKILRLAREISSDLDDVPDAEISRLVALGLYARALCWCAAYATDGRLRDPLDLTSAIWTGDPQALLDVFERLEIVKYDEGGAYLSGWEIRQHRAIRDQQSKAQRQPAGSPRVARGPGEGQPAGSPRDVRTYERTDVRTSEEEEMKKKTSAGSQPTNGTHVPAITPRTADRGKSSTPKDRAGKNPSIKVVLDAYHDAYLARHGTKPIVTGAHAKLVQSALRTIPEPELVALLVASLENPDRFFEGGLSAALSAAGLEKLRAATRGRKVRNPSGFVDIDQLLAQERARGRA